MKQILFSFFILVFAACAPTSTTPATVPVKPSSAPTSTQEPTRVVLTATSVLPTNTQTATLQPTQTTLPIEPSTPTATLSPSPAATKIVEPARNKIAFTHRKQGPYRTELYLMNPDGSNRQKLPTIGQELRDPAWSPDGRQIAYIAWEGDPNSEPAATRIIVSQIFLMNNDGSDAIQITHFKKPGFAETNYLSDLAWSPDGKKLIFSSNHEGSGRYDSPLYTINVDGSDLQRLTDSTWFTMTPAWSPDGTKIAFARGRKFAAPWDLFVMNADGSDLVRIQTGNNNWNPVWSHDGKYIYYVSTLSNKGFSEGIYLTGANGGARTLLRGGEGDNDIVYEHITLSPDGKFLALESGRSSFSERNIFVLSVDGKNITKLTDDSSGTWNAGPAWSPTK